MTKQEIKCVMSFSVYKHFDNVLNAVENDGLEGLNNDEVQKALTSKLTFFHVGEQKNTVLSLLFLLVVIQLLMI